MKFGAEFQLRYTLGIEFNRNRIRIGRHFRPATSMNSVRNASYLAHWQSWKKTSSVVADDCQL
jgi:hypothetical protein